jgi:hypothetical protein
MTDERWSQAAMALHQAGYHDLGEFIDSRADAERRAFRAGWYVNAASPPHQTAEYLAACEDVDWHDFSAITLCPECGRPTDCSGDACACFVETASPASANLHRLEDLESLLQSAEAARDQALAQVGRLREALEPFANQYGDVPRPDDFKLFADLTLGDFRRAAAALADLTLTPGIRNEDR